MVRVVRCVASRSAICTLRQEASQTLGMDPRSDCFPRSAPLSSPLVHFPSNHTSKLDTTGWRFNETNLNTKQPHAHESRRRCTSCPGAS